MEKTKKPYYIALAVLLVAAILLSSALGGLLYRRSHSGDSLVAQSNDIHKSFGTGFTDVTITDPDSALEAISSVKGDLGLSDAQKELKINVTQNYGKNKYYRFQQYYNGVPVYGREVVVGANKKGQALSLNANYRPLSKQLSKTPSADTDVVRANVRSHVQERYGEAKATDINVGKVSEGQLQYYDFTNDSKTALAYVVPVKVATETVDVIADAETGEVLEEVAEVPVPNTEISLVDHGESGALRVAYAELFDETNDGNEAAAKDPLAAGYPVEYRGKNWASTTAGEDRGNVNTNYTVFTNAVTQMLDGMAGAHAAISEDQMIRLLVGALLKFNLDETFQQAAEAVYAEAEYLASTGVLSSEQVGTVAAAFDAAGLPVAEVTNATVAEKSSEKETGNLPVVKEIKNQSTVTNSSGNTFDGGSSQATYDFDFTGKTVTIHGGDGVSNVLGLINLEKLADMPCLMADISEVYAQDAMPYFYPKDYLFLYYSDYIRSGKIKTVVFENNGSPWDMEIPDTHSTWECTMKDGLLQEIEIDGFSRDDVEGTTYPYSKHIYYQHDKNGRLVKVSFDDSDWAYEFSYDKNGNVNRCIVDGYDPEFTTAELNIETDRNGHITKRYWAESGEIVDTFEYQGGKLTRVVCPDLHQETVLRYKDGRLAEVISRDSSSTPPLYAWTYDITYQDD